MSKAIIALVLLFSGSFKGLQAQTIDCNRAFTKLEQAVCSNPRLELLESELSALSQQAVENGLVSARAVRAMRDQLAWRCSVSEEMDACLVEQTEQAIEQLTLKPAVIVEIPASHHPRRLLDRYAALQSEFQRAHEHDKATGSAAEFAQATFNLLDYFREEEGPSWAGGVRSYEIAALEATIAQGCGNLSKRRAWQKVIQDRGQSCDSALHKVAGD